MCVRNSMTADAKKCIQCASGTVLPMGTVFYKFYTQTPNEPRHDNPFTVRASASGHENLYILSCVSQAWITHVGWESLSVGEEGVSPWSRSVMAWRSARTDRMKD